MDRRKFLEWGFWAGAFASLLPEGLLPRRIAQMNSPEAAQSTPSASPSTPMILTTWDHGVAVNETAMRLLTAGRSALDAVEAGVSVSEADPKVTSVGLGGFPNAEGVMQLDAAIMNGANLDAGAVGGLERILHPIQVARQVMEHTPHVMLVGDGARRFALARGFDEQELLTASARRSYEEWKKKHTGPHVPEHSRDEAESGDGNRKSGSHGGGGGAPRSASLDQHDTVGSVAIDAEGRMAAACTTSGMAWKVPGRVGDSPIIGAGLYVDDEVGGCTATGVGEELIKVCGSFLAVELMRQGRSAQEAVEEVLRRAIRRDPVNQGQLLALAALRKDGDIGAASTVSGFKVAIAWPNRTELRDGKIFRG